MQVKTWVRGPRGHFAGTFHFFPTFLREIPEVLSMKSLGENTREKSESQKRFPKAAVQFNAAANTTAARSTSAAVYVTPRYSVIGKLQPPAPESLLQACTAKSRLPANF